VLPATNFNAGRAVAAGLDDAADAPTAAIATNPAAPTAAIAVRPNFLEVVMMEPPPASTGVLTKPVTAGTTLVPLSEVDEGSMAVVSQEVTVAEYLTR
jgi:hypothetical protein